VTTATQQGGVESMIQLYDSEIIKIEEVLEALNKRKGQRTDYERWTNEVKDRFHRVGLVVSVLWYEAGVERADGSMEKIEGTLIPEILVKARVDSKTFAFDHEQMGHEVQSDLLELGTGGKLKVTAEDARKALQSVRDHKHGAGCGH
jgi:hypothetical protein